MTTEIVEQVKHYISERYQKKRAVLEKNYEKQLKKIEEPLARSLLEQQHAQALDELSGQFETANWLDDAAKRAYQTNLATHVLKFIHSSAKGSNVFNLDDSPELLYLDSGCLKSPQIDATGNAAALDVAKLLTLETQGKTLAQHYKEKNDVVLASLARNESQWRAWAVGFREALETKTPSSHTLAKQVYFPVGEGEYHLLSPLYASSLSQEIYDRIQENRYGDVQKQARQAKREKKLHNTPCVSYPNLAVFVAGGTKPQNVSQLNSNRKGRTFLFPCTPPTWKAQDKPPLFFKTFFHIPRVNQAATQNLTAFSDFLKDISYRPTTHALQAQRLEMVSDIIDIVLDIAVSMRGYDVGWSVGSRFTRPYQLWLDAQRKEVEFQAEYHSKTWQDAVARDFGLWLGQELAKKIGDQTLLGQAQSQAYAKQFKNALRDMERFL